MEVALVLPILLLLLVFVVDVARAFDALIVLKNAAREGARFGTLANPFTPSEIQDLVVDGVVGSGTNVTSMMDFDISNVYVAQGTESVTVILTYDFPLWFGGLVGVDTFQLGAEAIMPRSFQ